MIGASIETTRELWASSLREVKKRIRPLFAQERAALNAGLFVDGLLGDERRKTGWMRAEAAGDPGPWRQQAVLGRNRWDADALRDLVRDYATEHLADENAVPVIDETGFLPQRVVGTAEEIAKTQRRSDWRRLSAGAGTKGPRLHDWCYLELADLEGEESNHHSQVLWTRGLLIRRNIANGDLAYFTTWCPAGTSIKTLVSVEGHRWAIEDSFETAKNEFGLDHNESRSWHGWHRHVSLGMLAFAMMAAIQHQANKPTPKKTKSSTTPRHPISSVGRSRKSAA